MEKIKTTHKKGAPSGRMFVVTNINQPIFNYRLIYTGDQYLPIRLKYKPDHIFQDTQMYSQPMFIGIFKHEYD